MLVINEDGHLCCAVQQFLIRSLNRNTRVHDAFSYVMIILQQKISLTKAGLQYTCNEFFGQEPGFLIMTTNRL